MIQHQEISKTPKNFLKNNTTSHVACYIIVRYFNTEREIDLFTVNCHQLQ